MKRASLLLLGSVVLAMSAGLIRSRGNVGNHWITFRVSPQIVSFTATPRRIERGEAVRVSWEVRGVNTVDLEWRTERDPRNSVQKRTGLAPSGELTLYPDESVVYVLSCQTAGADVCLSASASVQVRP